MRAKRGLQILCAIPVLIVVCLAGRPAQAKYSGGTGEPNDPYQIGTAADLIALGEDSNDYDKCFILTADIDLDPNLAGRKVFDKAVIGPGTFAQVVGWQGIPFTGILDGKTHMISHLTIKGGEYLGLFGQLASRGEVRDLGMVDVNIVCLGYGAAALAGYNAGAVTRCYSTGTVTGKSCVGGLTGSNGGSIVRSWSTVSARGTSYVGGLAGYNGGSVTQCCSRGMVGGTYDVGGLIGDNDKDVTQCYSTGTVAGSENVGGLVGGNSWGTVTQCYSSGAVNGEFGVGGLVGLGGVVFQSVWDMETSHVAASAGGIGKTTGEMQTAKTFLDAGWDFVGETANGSDDIWKITEGLGYPRLSWEKYSGGTGEPNDPYQIATATDLITLGQTPEDYDKHFILTADIDLDPNLPGRKVFDKAVIAPSTAGVFTGVFDGKGHTISHLTINGGSYLGLFGQLGSGAEVKDLGVVDVNIASSGGYVGGLVGDNHASVKCYSTGLVSGQYLVGGLVGDNDASVSQCYSTGLVSGQYLVGGLVGHNRGRIRDSYAAGSVAGGSSVGGLAGRNGTYGSALFGLPDLPGVISNCYSVSSVTGTLSVGELLGENACGPVTDCLWDMETSGQTISDGGTGKTTAEMQTAKTFLDAGWDFVGETANGTEDIWWITEGKDYPRLWWELKVEPMESAKDKQPHSTEDLQ